MIQIATVTVVVIDKVAIMIAKRTVNVIRNHKNVINKIEPHLVVTERMVKVE
jgi:hypothetical protein